MQTRAMPGERRTAPRILLTADELHIVQERVPALLLPSRFVQQWTDELSADERAERTRAALTGLIEKGFVAADVPRHPIPEDLSDWLLEPFMVFLSLHSVPAYVFTVSAWTLESTVMLVASARGGFASLLARAQSVSVTDGRGTAADLAGVEFAVLPFQDLAGELAGTIPLGGVPGNNGPLLSMSLTDSRGGIEVLRSHDPRLFDELSRRIGGPAAIHALSGLIGSFDAGFELRLGRADGTPVRVLNYVRGEAGWRSVDIRLPAGDTGKPTTEHVVDSGSISVAAVTRTAIQAEIASLCATITLREMAHE
jgi:hypothetical protein